MANKRPPIQVAELTENLKASTGQGIGAFFSQPTDRPAAQNEASSPRQVKKIVPPVPVVPPVPGKRIMRRRHPLDLYEDQYEFLLEHQKKERRQGRLGSMSEFVRNAIDHAIAEYRKK
jgi:hypothetical protein